MSNYGGRVRGRGRGQGRNGTGPCGQHTEKQTEDGETDWTKEGLPWSGWRERKMKRKGGWRVQRPPQIHGFDICVLLDSLLTARLSCPPTPPSSLGSSISPHWLAVKEGKESVEGGGHGREQQIPFPWTLHCARHTGTHLGMKGRLM